MVSKSTFQPTTLDDTSNNWLQPFSVLINCLLPVEYIYGDWLQWIEVSNAKHMKPESLSCPAANEIETGSRVEGFYYPQLVAKTDDCSADLPLKERDYWQPDLDCMNEHESFQENSPNIFTVEHIAEDPRYVKLRITDEWKIYKPRYKLSTFLNQSYLIPSSYHSVLGAFDNDNACEEIHGPVLKRTTVLSGLENFTVVENDDTGVFKYPQAWPESAMKWLVRSRFWSWPSPELVQNVFESGCHIAPVGRGKREKNPMELFQYVKDPSQASTQKETQCLSGESYMDETEWRLSFSVAENKLGQSVTPVQRHILVLLKMLKKLYFPEVVSSYHLKNLLFSEIENQEVFWHEDNSAKCLMHMLHHLQKCLEEGCLSHYIISESNLLLYEDPEKLQQAATIVKDVRQTILSKTMSMFKRIMSLTYVTPFYRKNLDWESITSKLSNFTMSEDKAKELTRSLLQLFANMCKSVVTHLITSLENEALKEEVKALMSVPIHAYKSLLGRCLCKLFFLDNLEKSDILNERNFTNFIKERVDDIAGMDEEFNDLLLVYFKQAQIDNDLSKLVPSTRFMQLTQQYYAISARQQFEKCSNLFGPLQSSDLKEIQKKVTEKFQGTALENLTIEEVCQEFMNELVQVRTEKSSTVKQD